MRLKPIALCFVLLILAMPSAAFACGIPFDAMITRERALLIDAGSTHHLIAEVDLADAGPNAAVLFPVPGLPSVDQPAGAEDLFAYLADATRPEIVVQQRLVFGRPSDTAGALPEATLLGRETLGGYDVARLAADDGNALLDWLSANNFDLSPAAAPILDAYSAEGWSFVAVRLADAAPNGSLAPLRISYPATELVYPMRLGSLSDQPVAVELYVLAAGRVALSALTTRYAGPVAALDPPPAPQIAALLADAAYLTRLSADDLAPASLTQDFRPQPAADNTSYREQQIVEEPVYLLSGSAMLGFALAALMFTSTLALVVSFYFRRRIDALSPDPEKRR